MQAPKRRKTSAQRDHRRAQWRKMAATPNSLCPQCAKPKLPHRVCPHCGTYKGRDILELD